MARPRLLLSDYNTVPPDTWEGGCLKLDEMVGQGLGQLWREHGGAYSEVRLHTHDLTVLRRPFSKAVLLRLMTRGRCWISDDQGGSRELGLLAFPRLLAGRLAARLRAPRVRRRIMQRVAALERRERQRTAKAGRRAGAGAPLYLRTDLVFGVTSGGSIAHISGVANALAERFGRLDMISSDVIPGLVDSVRLRRLRPDPGLGDEPEAQAKAFNDSVVNAARALRDDDPPAFIYQRYGVNNFSGVELARHWGVPLLLEYNGSEIWVNRNWGRSLGDEEGALRIETLNLKSADLVVPVSEVLGDELLERGVPRERILVNANGVDPDRYHPDVAAGRVRERLGLGARRVIGFIGTFGPWHGAEMLLESFIELLDLRPDLDDVHLLLIGDGAAMPAIRRRIAEAGVAARVSLPGRVPQALGPDYLAACDVLVSPHVPNADGSRFFGSPTKLFEYMAMGRPIVASDLEQIGALLTHEETALLVPPAEPEALARAVARLLDDTALGERLAAQARRVVMDRHSWARHTQRSLAGLQRVSGLDLGFT